MLAIIVILALALDRLVGEPRRGHPLVGFGNGALYLERKFNIPSHGKRSIIKGALCVLALVAPLAVLSIALKYWLQTAWGTSPTAALLAPALDILVLYWAIGLRSLHQHIKPIQRALEASNIELARQLVARVVSRDSAQMAPTQISSAAIETTIENGCDALFSVLFWYALGGIFMVIIYRLVNTLDAMWGYRTERFERFGKAAAKLDDLLNYIPARLTALTYGIFGNLTGALESWRRDAPKLDSPNAGPVMAAGAGSLNLRLGGEASYHGELKDKVYFGGTEPPVPGDISRALRLINLSTVLWCGVFLAATLVNQGGLL